MSTQTMTTQTQEKNLKTNSRWKRDEDANASANANPFQGTRDGGRGVTRGNCYNCGQPGHISRNCTNSCVMSSSAFGGGRGGDRRDRGFGAGRGGDRRDRGFGRGFGGGRGGDRRDRGFGRGFGGGRGGDRRNRRNNSFKRNIPKNEFKMDESMFPSLTSTKTVVKSSAAESSSNLNWRAAAQKGMECIAPIPTKPKNVVKMESLNKKVVLDDDGYGSMEEDNNWSDDDDNCFPQKGGYFD